MNPISSSPVLCGVARLVSAAEMLKGARIGLITNPTGLDRAFHSTIDLLHQDYDLCCLFSPEHGIRGDLQAGDEVSTYTDERTRLPVHSLYGESPRIPAGILRELDIIVYDIQDVGARFYTYLSTLSYAMQSCAELGKRVVVLDRPNPISGTKVEGTVLDPDFSSFVGRYPIATRHGLTTGEYARYINECQDIGCALTVVPLTEWERRFYFDETGLSFVPPSPNLPTVDSCVSYIGTCLFEGTNVSEGRGTTHPFELIGAPGLDAARVIAAVNEAGTPGVLLREAYFTPTFSKHAGVLCHGVQLHITDRAAYEPFKTGLRLLCAIRECWPEFAFLSPEKPDRRPMIDLLLGTDRLRLSEHFDPEAFFADQAPLLEQYRWESEPYYLY